MLAKRAPGYAALGFSDPRKLALTPSAGAERDKLSQPAATYGITHSDQQQRRRIPELAPSRLGACAMTTSAPWSARPIDQFCSLCSYPVIAWCVVSGIV
jgi:hypothetical protein